MSESNTQLPLAMENAESLLSTLPGIEGFASTSIAGAYTVTCTSPVRSVAAFLVKGGWEVMSEAANWCMLGKGLITFMLQ